MESWKEEETPIRIWVKNPAELKVKRAEFRTEMEDISKCHCSGATSDALSQKVLLFLHLEAQK